MNIMYKKYPVGRKERNMNKKITLDYAKEVANKVFCDGKGSNIIKFILGNFSMIYCKRESKYLDGELYFNLSPLDKAYATFGFCLRHNKYARRKDNCKYILYIGRLNIAQPVTFKPELIYTFNTEKDTTSTLKTILSLEYTGTHSDDISLIKAACSTKLNTL